MKEIILLPIGGLANRMLAISFFALYCLKGEKKLTVIWTKDKFLNCSFKYLFEHPQLQNVEIKDATLKDLILNDRPKKRNFKLTRFMHPFFYQRRVYENEYNRLVVDIEYQKSFFKEIEQYSKTFIVGVCHPYYIENMMSIFKPNNKLKTKIDELVSTFPSNTIGIHIRRTDNINCIKESPIDLFIDKINHEIEQDKNVSFLVASDSIKEKKELINLFGNKIITSLKDVRRDKPESIQEALIELYSLSLTKKIYGSYSSTFSHVAGMLNNKPITLLRLDNI